MFTYICLVKQKQNNVMNNKTTTLSSLRGNVKQSINELYQFGITRTGSSGYSKGWAKKLVWTGDVLRACDQLGIIVEFGNDAPRGGASGEYVRLVSDKRKNRSVWAVMAENKANRNRVIAEREAADAERAAIIKARQENVARIANELLSIAVELRVFTNIVGNRAERHIARQQSIKVLSQALREAGHERMDNDVFYPVMNQLERMIAG